MLLEGCACGGALCKTSAQHCRPVSVGQSDNMGQQPRRRSKPTKVRELRLRHLGSGNLQTRLARRRASAQYLWLRYPGRGSGSGQPDSPPQSPELTCVRWARGDSHRWRVTSHRWRVVIRLLTLVPGPRLRLGKSMQTLWRSCGVCRTAAPPGRDVVFMVEKQRKTLSGG